MILKHGQRKRICKASRFFIALGLVSIALGLVSIVVRGWYRLRTEPRFTSANCPRCDSQLPRSHRTRWDWILNRFVPVRRYKCRDRQCGWTGLRVKSLSSTKNACSDFGSDSGSYSDEGIIGTYIKSGSPKSQDPSPTILRGRR